MYAEHREDIKQIGTGDIAALLGLKDSVTGDTLCAIKQPLQLESITFPDPVIKITISPITAQDNDKLADALQQLAEDDPTFKFEAENETGQTLLGGMGELHLEIILQRLKREHGVTVRTGKPRVAYKETIQVNVNSAEGRFVRQTGGHGQYGHVILRLTPDKTIDGVIFENGLNGNAIPSQFIPAIETGFFQREIARSAYEYQKALEKKEKFHVGVNIFEEEEEEVDIELLKISEKVEKNQINDLEQVKKERNKTKVKETLQQLRNAAASGENLMPRIINCVREYATLGEMCNTLKEEFGVYKETSIF
jgi:hypothetical protein